jgi:hypothetical protein
MFPVARKLPHLTALSLHAICMPDVPESSPEWGASDLSSLVSCCPGLCDIMGLSLRPGAHVSELHTLTALTHVLISLKGPDSFNESVMGLAGLTQLHFLGLVHWDRVSPTFVASSLLPLTSLTALTQLEVDWMLATDDDMPELELRFSTTQVMTGKSVTVVTAALYSSGKASAAVFSGWCLLPAHSCTSPTDVVCLAAPRCGMYMSLLQHSMALFAWAAQPARHMMHARLTTMAEWL